MLPLTPLPARIHHCNSTGLSSLICLQRLTNTTLHALSGPKSFRECHVSALDLRRPSSSVSSWCTGAPTLWTTTMNYLGSTSRRHLWATSSAAVSAGTAPTSCTNPSYYRIPSSQLPAAKKQRLIDAMKVTLEIAKELTDVPPPLKSCLAGINALIKHYDVRFHRIKSQQ